MQQVVFRLLGPPEIRYQDQLVKIPRRRSRALLYYLVCTQTPQPRERLLTLLCGEVDEESARRIFKTLLAEVRALLRSFDTSIEWIISDADQLKLKPSAPFWLDTEIFEKVTAITSRGLSQAIDLYRGDFLDGFYLKDSPGFEAWTRSTRDHFRRLYLTTLRRLAELYESDKQLEQAIACIQMLLATDPLQEEAYAHLMRLSWASGKRIEALRQYEHLCTILAQELAIKPSPTTQALYEQIVHRSKEPFSRPPEPAFFVPAQQEQVWQPSSQATSIPDLPSPPTLLPMEWLQYHLTGSDNQYPLLLLHDRTGFGKIRLIQEIIANICPSWLVLQGTCQEVEQEHAYHAIVEALRQGLVGEDTSRIDLPEVWIAQIAQLLPDIFRSATAPLQYTLIEPLILADALVALFNKLAHPQRPLLLILDDLHWADTPTFALLGHLARHVRRGHVFLLGVFCDDLAQEQLEPLRRSALRQHTLAELVLSPPDTEIGA